MSRRFIFISAAAIAAAVLLAHGRGLFGEWIGPDRGLVDRSPLAARSVSAPPAAGTTPDALAASAGAASWIAEGTAALSLAAERAVWGASSPAFRATSRVLHAIAAFLFFLFALRWTGLTHASLAAALVFAVHPVAVETLDTTAGRGQILAAAFGFLSMLLVGQARTRAGDPGRAGGLPLVLALAAFVVASFASAIALVLPLALIGYDAALAAAGGPPAARRAREWALFAAAAVPAVFARAALAPPVAPADRTLAGRALLEALRILALPAPLDYYRILAGPGSAGATAWISILAAALVTAILLALVFLPGAPVGRVPRLAILSRGAGAPWLRAVLASVPALWVLTAWILGASPALLAAGIVIAAVLLAVFAASARGAAPPESRGRTALAVLLIVAPCLALVVLPTEGPGSDIPFPLLDHRLYLPAAGMALLLGLFLFGFGAEGAAASGPSGRPARLAGPEKRSAARGARPGNTDATGAAAPGSPALWVGAAAVIVALGAASLDRHGLFETDAILYATTAATSPSIELRIRLAHAAAARGQADRAIEVIKRLIVMEPENASLHLVLANLLRDLRDLDAAEAEARAALSIDPTLAAAQVTLGLIARERGEAAKAEESYREAIRLDPSLDEAHSNLGVLLTAKGATADALTELKRAVEIDPANGDAAANLASLLLEQKLVDEALAAARRGLTLSSGNPRLHYVLGVALQRKNDPKGAARAYEEAIRLAPDYARPRLNLGAIYGDQRRFEEAAEMLERVVELEPNNERAHYSLGMAYRGMGKTDLAAAQFFAALKLRPDYTEANRALTGLFAPGGPGRGAPGPPSTQKP